jgi:hypothetical protein
VDVVEDQDERPTHARASDEVRDGFEQREASALELDPGSLRRAANPRVEFGNQTDDLIGTVPDVALELIGFARPDVAPEDLDPRPVRGRPTALPAPAPQDVGTGLGRVRAQPVGEARLADARLTGDEEQAARSVQGLGESRAQLRELALAIDERRTADRLHRPRFAPRHRRHLPAGSIADQRALVSRAR